MWSYLFGWVIVVEILWSDIDCFRMYILLRMSGRSLRFLMILLMIGLWSVILMIKGGGGLFVLEMIKMMVIIKLLWIVLWKVFVIVC